MTVYNKEVYNKDDVRISGTFIDITREWYAVIRDTDGKDVTINDGRMRATPWFNAKILNEYNEL